MNSTETAACLTVVAGGYPTLEITDEMALLWDNAFASDDGHTVKAAVVAWVNTEQFPPTVAGIRQKMREARAAQARDLSWTSRRDPQERTVSFDEGRAIAAIAYEAECTRQGREPNWDYWNSAMGLTGRTAQRTASYR